MIEIREVRIEDIEKFNDLLNSICKERLYLGFLDGIPLEEHRSFVKNVIRKDLPQVMAVSNSEVVGWCDVLPNSVKGFTHTGQLGMGVAKTYRSQGLGSKLLSSCLEAARLYGLEKVELEVYTDNTPACRLYEQHGFFVEGLKSKSRKIDGKYQDIQLMGLWLNAENA